MLIRFKKNDGTEYPQWEEKTLQTLGEFYGGLSGKTKEDFGCGTKKYITYMNVYKNQFIKNELLEHVKIGKDEKQNTVEYGDMLFTQSSETVEEVGLTSVYLYHDKPYLNSFCMGFHLKEQDITLPEYMGYLMRTNGTRKQIMREGQGISRINLSGKRILNIKLPIPCLEEQQKIADFLSTVDQKIEAQKSIVTDYEELKKGTMQKIFNQELRFRDDNGNEFPEWMEKRLGDVLDISTKSNNGKYSKEEVLSVSDKFGVVNQIKLQGRSFAGDDISKYKVVETDDIIYTKSPLLEKPFGIIKIVKNEVGAVSPLYIVNKAKNGNYPLFIYYYFDSPSRTNNYLKPLIRKGAKNTMNISNEEWLSGKVKIPCFKEQKKIADCLSALDRKIEAEKKILADLEELKKGLLQAIFN